MSEARNRFTSAVFFIFWGAKKTCIKYVNRMNILRSEKGLTRQSVLRDEEQRTGEDKVERVPRHPSASARLKSVTLKIVKICSHLG